MPVRYQNLTYSLFLLITIFMLFVPYPVANVFALIVYKKPVPNGGVTHQTREAGSKFKFPVSILSPGFQVPESILYFKLG
jgi:hypothetical protein